MFKIRRAKVEDAEEIVNAEREIAQTPGFFCSLPDELTEINVVKTVSALARSHQGVYLVVESQENMVGHAFLEPLSLKLLSHVAQLSICVHNGWQSKGVGSQLLQAVIDWAKKSRNIEKIELNVRSTNDRAIVLYQKKGFKEEGRLKNRVKVNGAYIDDIMMGLDVKDEK